MEAQTSTRPRINVTNVIKEMNLSQIKDLGYLGTGKVFPYVEHYHANKYFKAIETPRSPISLSKILQNLQNKPKKREASHYHSLTLKYQDSKYANLNFIENARRELSHLQIAKPTNRPSNYRSISETNEKIPLSKYSSPHNKLKDLIIIPVPIVRKRIKNNKTRNDSLADCSIDLQTLDLPYAYKFLNSQFS